MTAYEKIIPYFSREDETKQVEMIENIQIQKLDCYSSRVISQNGIYSCPMLVDDYRGKVGSCLNNYSKINYLDCEKCSICASVNQKVQVNDWM